MSSPIRRTLVLLASSLLLILPSAGVHAQPERPQYETTPVADGVYQFRWQSHNALFVVTDDGVVVMDPINPDAAARLAAEIRRTAPGLPLRAVVYSHAHADHASGGDVLREAMNAPDAPIIAHDFAAGAIAIAPRDDQPPPTVTFSESMILWFGHRSIELRYLGPSHSDNLIVAYLHDVGVAFAVDFVSADRVGYRDLGSFHFPEQFAAIEHLLDLPFETIVFGHGPPGDRAAVERQLAYYRDLRDAVAAAIAEGLTEDEAAARVRLPAYADWGGYDAWFPLNVRGMYRALRGEGPS